MECSLSEYASFIHEHNAWLDSGDRTTPRLPFKYLGTLYLENALWPDLYPFRSYCDSRWNASDVKMRSAKASFLVKCCSSIVDYGSSFELLQFHYDRWILNKFRGRDAASKVDLKYALKDINETPYCCYLNHMKMVDIHRQLGPGKYLLTFAPGAFGTTWHAWIWNQVKTSGAPILSHPVPEMMHLTHALDGITRRYVLDGPHSPFWIPSKKTTCIRASAIRLEFQEGTRATGHNAAKPGVPNRDGTGLPHVHIVVWTNEHEHLSNLTSHLRADLPKDQLDLHKQVLRYQGSHASDLPLESATFWEPTLNESGDFAGWKLHIAHDAEAHDHHVRPYFAGLCIGRFAHQDVGRLILKIAWIQTSFHEMFSLVYYI